MALRKAAMQAAAGSTEGSQASQAPAAPSFDRDPRHSLTAFPMPSTSASMGSALRSAAGTAAARSAGSTSTETDSSWSNYFDASHDVRVDETSNTFRVYSAGDALGDSVPVVVFLHGAGHTSLSWALVAGMLKAQCRVVAVDFRGHGNSTTSDDADLSAHTVTSDVIAVLNAFLGRAGGGEGGASAAMPLRVVLCGHSMGGAIAAHVGARFRTEASPTLSLSALIVIDVVEGTAMAALQHMHRVLAARPARFRSEADAIEWTLRSGMVRNRTSARVSVPPQLVQRDGDGGAFTWKTDLHASEPHWRGWFEGLSELFLSVPTTKMLMLAGTDRLDTPLTIAQMQGKFQFKLLYGCGHTMQEDSPDQAAEAIRQLMQRIGLIQGRAGEVTEHQKLMQKLAKAKAMAPTVK